MTGKSEITIVVQQDAKSFLGTETDELMPMFKNALERLQLLPNEDKIFVCDINNIDLIFKGESADEEKEDGPRFHLEDIDGEKTGTKNVKIGPEHIWAPTLDELKEKIKVYETGQNELSDSSAEIALTIKGEASSILNNQSGGFDIKKIEETAINLTTRMLISAQVFKITEANKIAEEGFINPYLYKVFKEPLRDLFQKIRRLMRVVIESEVLGDAQDVQNVKNALMPIAIGHTKQFLEENKENIQLLAAIVNNPEMLDRAQKAIENVGDWKIGDIVR